MDDPVQGAKPADDMLALEEAVKKAEGFGALAKRIGVAASAPSMWRKRGSVPAEHCPAIERETGVPCERLNPSVDWGVLREASAPPASDRASGRGTLHLKREKRDPNKPREKPSS
jgi:DNA-binding transcriptional regulator YdaS (Cro superfamily)